MPLTVTCALSVCCPVFAFALSTPYPHLFPCRTPPAALPSSAPELLQKQPKDNQHKEESATNTTTTAATSSSSRSSILSTLRAEAAQHQEHVRSLGLQLSNERDNGASLAQALAATQERLEAAVARAVCAEGEAANRQQHLALLQEQVAGMQGRLGGEEADGDEEEGEAVFEFV
jgi:hypothetical protein